MPTEAYSLRIRQTNKTVDYYRQQSSSLRMIKRICFVTEANDQLQSIPITPLWMIYSNSCL